MVSNIQELMMTIAYNVVWVVFVGIAIICIVIAGVKFLSAMGDAKKINEAKSAFIWGVAGVAVGIIAYSIITIVGNILA